MAGDATTDQSNIKGEFNTANTGMNLDLSVSQIPKGTLSYALNAAVENFDSNSINYQNESGNEFCLSFPEGYQLIGKHFIVEQNKHIFFLVNPVTESSEIGYMENNDCVYLTLVNAACLNFNVNYPIHKVVHKITNCTTEIYWTDGINPRRFLDLGNIPYKLQSFSGLCDPVYTNELDCNQINIQPNFTIPQLDVVDITTGGDLKAGTYQFAIQYANVTGEGYTSYYSVTNPTPIADIHITTMNFDYNVGKSIIVNVSNLETSGQFQYFNLAVIKTINGVSSVELAGTYFIDRSEKNITYTGQNVTQIRLTINEIFEKYPYYEIAQDLTAVQDVLVWDNLTSIDRINYQGIANRINLLWQSYRIPATENYADELNATNLRGYLRDEVYAFEIVFLLHNGKQTDGFHIPGRIVGPNETLPDVPSTNPDFIGEPDYSIGAVGYSKYWRIYNTGSVIGYAPEYIGGSTYKGAYQYGEFAYWESTEEYPCNTNVWGNLAGQKIRHHKFPDVLVSPIIESAIFSSPSGMTMQKDAVFPIGVRIDLQQITQLIQSSNLTQEQKDSIAGFKIVRGDRGTNKSIVAKGMLRNVGKYTREESDYYYPNYPYNDLNKDVFLLDKSNAYTATALQGNSSAGTCRSFHVIVTASGTIQYIDCYTNTIKDVVTVTGDVLDVCSLIIPIVTTGTACITSNTYRTYLITTHGPFSSTILGYIPPVDGAIGYPGTPPSGWPSWCAYCTANPADGGCRALEVTNINLTSGSPGTTITVKSLVEPYYISGAYTYIVKEISSTGYDICNPKPVDSFTTDSSRYRQVFNSPETSFGQPFLGDVLKLENVMFGAGSAHFVQVKKNALYKLITREAQQDALNSAANIAGITTTFSASALFAAYQAYLAIYTNGITRRNYGYSFNSVASYDYTASIANNIGLKQRPLDIALYLIPGVQSVGDDNNVNNYQRESSVYIKTKESVTALPFPSQTPSMISGGTSIVTDTSRFTISEKLNCNNPGKSEKLSVVSYYASIKNTFVNQWGQIYSYDTIDTGFQRDITPISTSTVATIFGGDTFISKFAYKTKLPFFIDNRVNAPDDSDIFYDEIGNVAYPLYWHSARSVLSDVSVGTYTLKNFISIKAHNLDCPNTQTPDSTSIPNPGRTYYDGKMYMFAYGVPYFYCETSINVDLRQAFNNREGDFWPHVSTGIPDDWVQEYNVPIAQDNTYYYNVTFSKQNRENFFTHLPPDWEAQLCFTNFPFKAIYSDAQDNDPSNRTNNWLTYRAVSFFDFPQNYGNLISLDGIQNKTVLARFENKSLLYNTLLTVDTSNPQAAYLGNSTLFKSSPPIDFAETDLGYVGSQNKMLLKIPQGQVTIDAKRGQVFLISGNQATDISAFGSGMNRFFTDHLAFEILRYFPTVNTDNHYTGIGLHGVYDSKYDRVIITKLDYIPIDPNVKYDDVTKEFYIETTITFEDDSQETLRTIVYLTDLQYFCNKSWTLSYNVNTKSWISFHSYIPNFYIAENNFFYSGMNDCCDVNGFAGIVAELIEETTTTTTTTALPCLCYMLKNTLGPGTPVKIFSYTNCDDEEIIDGIGPGTFKVFCAKKDSVVYHPSLTLTSSGLCSVTCVHEEPVVLDCTLIGTATQRDCSLDGNATEIDCSLDGTIFQYCNCYTMYNGTGPSAPTVPFTYKDCNGVDVSTGLGGGPTSVNFCAVPGTIVYSAPLVLTDNGDCTSGCVPTTSTTTTTPL